MSTFSAPQTYGDVDLNSHPIPITATSGNLLLVFASNYNGSNQDLNTPSGWTKLGESITTQVRPAVFAKISDGTEGSTVALTTGGGSNPFDCAAVSYSISEWYGDLSGVDISAFVTQASSASISDVDPATVTASWGAEASNLFITAGFAARANKPFTVAPTGYTGVTNAASGADGSGYHAKITTASKTANAASDDPSVFTAGTYQNMAAVTVVVRSEAANQAPIADNDTFSIFDNAANGSTVGTYTATDSDGTVDVYSITGSTLAINNAGVITIADNTGIEAGTDITATVTATDNDGATDTALITVTVSVPALSIDSIDDATPEPGDYVTYTVSNKAGTITASCSAGALTVTNQTSTTVTITAPEPPLFGDKTLNYLEAISVTLNDGTNTDTDTDSITIQVPANEEFAQITEINASGIYDNDVGVEVGDWAHAKSITTDVVVDLTTGLDAFPESGGSYEYALRDATDNTWGSYAPVTTGIVITTASSTAMILHDVLKPILSNVIKETFEE